MPSWLTPLDGITKRSARLKERLVVVCAQARLTCWLVRKDAAVLMELMRE
jgi:hypothetical protein